MMSDRSLRGESMLGRKFIRLAASLLMIMALTLPVAPFTSPALAQTITTVTPDRLADEGSPPPAGTPVTITGTGFIAGSTVTVTPTGAPPIVGIVPTTQTATSIVFQMPAAPPGAVINAQNVGVAVVPPAGATASCGSCFGWYALTLTFLTPATGPPGTVVTLNGTGFVGPTTAPPGPPAPPQNMAVTFAGTVVAVTIVSSTQATIVVPATAPAGSVSVTATDPTPLPPNPETGTLSFTVTGAVATGTVTGTVTGA
jgi:hypothetical protein